MIGNRELYFRDLLLLGHLLRPVYLGDLFFFFLIYINDIVGVIHSCIRLFAYDDSLYIIVDNPINAADELNADLAIIHAWAVR